MGKLQGAGSGTELFWELSWSCTVHKLAKSVWWENPEMLKCCGCWQLQGWSSGQDVLGGRSSASSWTPAPSPRLPSTLLTRTSFHMFCSSWLACALSSERGQSWQGAGFVVLRVFSCGHWCWLVRDGKKGLIGTEKQLCLAKLINTFL